MLLRGFALVSVMLMLFSPAVVAQTLSSTGLPTSSMGQRETDLFQLTQTSSSPVDAMKKIRKPPVGLASEWITAADSGVVSARANTTLPLLFLGSPPPLVRVGFAYTDLLKADQFGLPEDLYEYTIGVSWFRKVNERWTLRTMLGVGLASDNVSTSSDAWQFRGGLFAMYRRDSTLTWTFGALATGRRDLPVIPAIGAVWMPSPQIRWDATFPKPRVNFLINDDGERQQWCYVGVGINGNTWAYERSGQADDQLTYKDWRFVLGWESRPAASAGSPFAFGRMMQAEIGYVFAREYEFNDEARIVSLGDSFMFGVSTRF